MSDKKIPYKIYLSEEEIPKAWYNVRADMKTDHRPILHPGTLQPVTEADLTPVFCDELVKQELNDKDRFIEIPEEIRDFYKMYRPSPLIRAYCLEKSSIPPPRFITNMRAQHLRPGHKLNSPSPGDYANKQDSGVTRDGATVGTALSILGYFDSSVRSIWSRFLCQKQYRKV
jgi:tryptophan synthase beta chain